MFKKTLILVFTFFLFWFFYSKIKASSEMASKRLETENQSSETLSGNRKSIMYYRSFSEKNSDQVNILLLGLDGRAGDSRPRCDAIHMISFLEKENKVIITSVPRGTYVDSSETATESAYISNICHLKGIDYAVSEIEKITGNRADYLVKVGFSQSMGILRLLDFPAVPTLQFLRNRRVGLGDFQRSHNQALFLKDLLTNHFDRFANLPETLQYVVFSLLDTNLTFHEARDLLLKLRKSGLYKNPNNIILLMRPPASLNLKDMHYDFTKSTDNETTDPEYQAYQEEIRNLLLQTAEKAEYHYQDNRKSQALKTVETIFRQKLWEQIEDESQRSEIYFRLLKIYVLSSPPLSENRRLVKDFIEEMKIYRNQILLEKGEELLNQL